MIKIEQHYTKHTVESRTITNLIAGTGSGLCIFFGVSIFNGHMGAVMGAPSQLLSQATSSPEIPAPHASLSPQAKRTCTLLFLEAVSIRRDRSPSYFRRFFWYPPARTVSLGSILQSDEDDVQVRAINCVTGRTQLVWLNKRFTRPSGQ